MLEELLVYAILLEVGLASNAEYVAYLDALFMKASDNDLLLALEWGSTDANQSISTIRNHCAQCSIDYDAFGRFLFSKLADIYSQNKIDIQTFGEKAYAMWKQFPRSIHQTEPFWTLCYADDPLSWGDEKQTRELYEKAFRYYDNKPNP